MTLDDAIAHAEEKAKDCATECGREHQQLAGWLRELSTARTAIAKLPAADTLRDLQDRIDQMQQKWLSPEAYQSLMNEREETLHELALLKAENERLNRLLTVHSMIDNHVDKWGHGICMKCWAGGLQNEGRPCPVHDKEEA